MATVLTDIPDTEALLALPAEELAPIVLRTAVEDHKEGLPIAITSLTYQIYDRGAHTYAARFPHQKRREVERALGEAWHLLTTDRLLMPEPGYNGQNGIMEVTAKGKVLLENPDQFRGFTGATALPKGMLHPTIAEPVWKALVRGDLETAVLESFRAVEIAVREVGKFGAEDVGVDLMRMAFNTKNGPLTDKNLPDSEREALAHLFAGAIGYYKNPQSHRDAKIGSQRRAQEIALLASHLLYIVDARRP
jgi:uncharacterized protein (TIGR02391 family)